MGSIRRAAKKSGAGRREVSARRAALLVAALWLAPTAISTTANAQQTPPAEQAPEEREGAPEESELEAGELEQGAAAASAVDPDAAVDPVAQKEEGVEGGAEVAREEESILRRAEDVSDATPEERAALDQYQTAFARYRQESNDYQATVDGIVESKYRQKVSEVQSVYNRQIDELTSVERAKRNDAIASFEEFIKKHPTNEKYTPDALFRLAELYFEKSNDDYLLADEDYVDAVALHEAGKTPDPPPMPRRDYGPTIATFQKLIDEWPDLPVA